MMPESFRLSELTYATKATVTHKGSTSFGFEYVLDRNEVAPEVYFIPENEGTKKGPEGSLPQGSKALAAATLLGELAYKLWINCTILQNGGLNLFGLGAVSFK